MGGYLKELAMVKKIPGSGFLGIFCLFVCYALNQCLGFTTETMTTSSFVIQPIFMVLYVY